ncbi:hypothetical protein CU669_19910 [Paramagnetospirillum kuznetsovii]|uniref:Uncharacterized protein n=1 Tax=Paramagnetospirillum kuznetsovii TaxID=2053833 RepID=A0A364NTE9_9PROT|nr:hypothetical protein CU669_19910 [Paramagnetospirillum kuznetsovii]
MVFARDRAEATIGRMVFDLLNIPVVSVDELPDDVRTDSITLRYKEEDCLIVGIPAVGEDHDLALSLINAGTNDPFIAGDVDFEMLLPSISEIKTITEARAWLTDTNKGLASKCKQANRVVLTGNSPLGRQQKQDAANIVELTRRLAEQHEQRKAEMIAEIERDMTAFIVRLENDPALANCDECGELIRRIEEYHPNAISHFQNTLASVRLRNTVHALGYSISSGDEYYHFIGDGKGVITRTKRDFASNNIMTFTPIAPAEFWLENFPKLDANGMPTAKIDPAKIGVALQKLCRAHEYWSERDQNERLRGRGTWIDTTIAGAEIAVTHYGSKLHITDTDGSLTETDLDGGHFGNRLGHYIYLAKGAMARPNVNSDITQAEADKLRSITLRLRWQDPVSAHLLAGFIMSAPICGALKWRTHLWIEGGAGSGKTWLLSNVLMPLMPTLLGAQSDSTAAGLRHALDSDAKPISFDEAEGETEKDKINIGNVVHLARAASSAGAASYKGTADGKGTSYSLYTMFVFASIGVTLNQGADASRIARLAIKPPPNINLDPDGNAAAQAKFVQLQKDIRALYTPDFTMRLQARRTRAVLRMDKNAALLADIIGSMSGTNRMGDTLSLMAGDIELKYGRELTREEIEAYLSDAGITAEYLADNHAVELDHVKLINIESQLMLETVTNIPGVKIDFPFRQCSLGQLMLDAMECGDGLTDKRVARYTLETVGFKILDSHDSRAKFDTARHPGHRYYIAMAANINTFGRLKELLKRSSNASQWENTAPAIIKSGFSNLLLDDKPRQQMFYGIPNQIPCFIFSPELFINKTATSSKLHEFANDDEAAA